MNILFLDVDGVLQPTNAEWFSMSALRLLRKLVQRTDAKIVLSSNWRLLAATRKIVADRLKLVGLEIFDVTPRSVGGGVGNRANEIADWLERAQQNAQIGKWAVLDDRDVEALNPTLFHQRCVLVNAFTGFRFCDFERALAIFGLEAESDMGRALSIENLEALRAVGFELVPHFSSPRVSLIDAEEQQHQQHHQQQQSAEAPLLTPN